jgi:hypothetical protein
MKYNIRDITEAEPMNIDTSNAIVLMYDGSDSYKDYFINIVKTIKHLHNVKIIVICDKNSIESLDIEYLKNNNLSTDIVPILIEDVYECFPRVHKFIKKIKFFQYIKPFVIKHILDIKNVLGLKKILYLDIDILPLRRLDQIFDAIDQDPVMVEELGLDIGKYGYRTYINDPYVYSIFTDIEEKNRIKFPQMPVNTGVLGFDLTRELDINIINTWKNLTIECIKHRLGPEIVKWWDQGIFLLVVESLGISDKISKNQKFNHTIYIKDNNNIDLSRLDSNLVHFIGDIKPVLKQDLYYTNNNKKIKIAVCGHSDLQCKNFHNKKYFKFYNLNSLNFDNSLYRNNTFSESRILLSTDPIFSDEYDILGTITASWFNKYQASCLDQLYNWHVFNLIDNLPENHVICASLCMGNNCGPGDPLFRRNFQKHFRKIFPYTDSIQDIIYDVTNMEYKENTVAPYSNQIIANKNLFFKYKNYMCNIIPKLIDAFGIDFNFYPASIKGAESFDVRRPFGYLVEEVSMLWWSNQPGLVFVSITHPKDSWYEKQGYLK